MNTVGESLLVGLVGEGVSPSMSRPRYEHEPINSRSAPLHHRVLAR